MKTNTRCYYIYLVFVEVDHARNSNHFDLTQ